MGRGRISSARRSGSLKKYRPLSTDYETKVLYSTYRINNTRDYLDRDLQMGRTFPYLHTSKWSLLWKCWCMSMYWSMLSSTALVCIVDLTSIVDLICVCWNLTYTVELLPSVISLQEPLPHYLWISLDHHGILAIVSTPAYPAVSICVCWPPKRRVYNITSSSLLRRRYLLLLCCLLKVSQYS